MFTYPSIYAFPPFFTIQPNDSTRASQLSLWCRLVLEYYAHHKLWRLDSLSTSSLESPLFYNRDINRRLDSSSVRTICAELVSIGRAAWLSTSDTILDNPKSKDVEKATRIIVYWKRPEEWADLIHAWITNNGLTNSVMTKYEVTRGDLVTDSEWYELDELLLDAALNILVKRGQAQVFSGSMDDGGGVKFF